LFKIGTPYGKVLSAKQGEYLMVIIAFEEGLNYFIVIGILTGGKYNYLIV